MPQEIVNSSDNINTDVGGDLFDRYFTGRNEAIEVSPRTYFCTADYVNCAAFETDAGLVLIDCGQLEHGESIHTELRKLTKAPLHTVIYTHGHLDHCFGLKPWLDEGNKPQIIAHENVIQRFQTYQRTGPLNGKINAVQFGIDTGVGWPTDDNEFFWPTKTYRKNLSIEVGGETFELSHAKGETDDVTWVWSPGRRVAVVGDLVLGILPNCGNPQKKQRYAEGWAQALVAIADKHPQIMLSGHGEPHLDSDQIQAVCRDTAEALQSLVDQTLHALNEGLRHEQIIERVKIPEHLRDKPYLTPLYDRPEFIVRNIIRLEGGWWNGHSAQLMASPLAEQAREIVALAGGADAVVNRANALAETDLRLACHLAEWAAEGSPDSVAAHRCRIELFERRADDEVALMARGVFNHACRLSSDALNRLGATVDGDTVQEQGGGAFPIESIDEYFERLHERFVSSGARKVDVVVQYDFKGNDPSVWSFGVHNGELKNVKRAPADDANLRITVKSEDFVAMTNGNLDAKKAFLTRKMKVKGNMMLAIKMREFLPPVE